MTAPVFASGVYWQAVVIKTLQLSLPPTLSFVTTAPTARLNVALTPQIGMRTPESFVLVFTPRIAMGETSKATTGRFGLSLSPSIGMAGGLGPALRFTPSISMVAASQPVFAYWPVIIPNRFVGPMALRQVKRMPYVSSVAAAPLAPAYDSSALSPSESGGLASGSPFTWSHTATAGAYAIVVVLGGGNAMDLSATASVTFGGTSLSSLGSLYVNNAGSGAGWVWVFGANNVNGGSQTVSVTLTESGQTFFGYAASFTYTNVSSVGSLQTAFGASTSPSVSVPSAVGDLVWGSIAVNGQQIFTGFSLTARQFDQNDPNNFPNFIAGDKAGAASVAVSATASSSINDYWAAVGLNLI